MRLVISVDSQYNVDDLHTIEGSLPPNYVTLHVTGLLKATKGQRISAAVATTDSAVYEVYVRSGETVLSHALRRHILKRDSRPLTGS